MVNRAAYTAEAAFLLALLSAHATTAFQPATTRSRRSHFDSVANRRRQKILDDDFHPMRRNGLFLARHDNRKQTSSTRFFRGALASFLRRIPRLLQTISLALSIGFLTFSTRPPSAEASAPVMALPKADDRDPGTDALLEQERRMTKEAQEELSEMGRQAREIEATGGEAARVKFEKEFKEKQKQRAEDKVKGFEELKRSLLDQGIDPHTDMEGRRQVILYEKGVDLGDVQGTPFYLEKEFERSNFKRSMAYKLAPHRKIIACMVQDMKNRGIDPLEYFETHPDNTEKLLELPDKQAQALLAEYTANLEQYGQIVPPKPGEESALEKMAKAKAKPEDKKAAREKARLLKAEEAAKKKAEQQRVREEKKAARLAAAAEKKAAKEGAKQAKEEAKKAEAAKKAAAAAAVASAAAVGATASATMAAVSTGADAAAGTVQQALAEAPPAVEQAEGMYDSETGSFDEDDDEGYGGSTTAAPAPPAAPQKESSNKIPIVPVSAFLVAAAGGGYSFKLLREKAARDEEERQRQFRLLMGMNEDGSAGGARSPGSAPALEEVDADVPPPEALNGGPAANTPAAIEPPPPPAAKKRRMGLKNVFAKKRNNRETDILRLVGGDAEAPEYALKLAKILTFGAPGRFPGIVALPGEMPMVDFDLEAAKLQLIEARAASNLKTEESAEIFANVVNCMLIDIVDLGSTSLKEKDQNLTVSAIDIVVDFMLHAASLYDAVAEGVVIEPVTYGGDLSKSKLESMYSVYAGSIMTDLANVREDMDERTKLLLDVFQITEKRAEGLMMKAMQKQMMEMIKSGKGLDGLGDMAGMQGMEGLLGGMDGAGGMPEDLSPEQIKEMLVALKQMKESGAFSKEDMEQIKQQFRESFGSSIDDLEASDEGMTEDEKEMVEMMKSILDD